MDINKLFTYIILPLCILFNSCGSFNKKTDDNNSTKETFLKIDGDIDDIYSFSTTENPRTGKTLSQEEANINRKIFQQARERVVKTVRIDTVNRKLKIYGEAKSLYIDQNLYDFIKNGYLKAIDSLYHNKEIDVKLDENNKDFEIVRLH